jgi:hypothetical protein
MGMGEGVREAAYSWVYTGEVEVPSIKYLELCRKWWIFFDSIGEF